MIQSHRPTARRTGVLTEDVGDEVVVFDRETGNAHRLNRAATFVWRRCDGRTPVSEPAFGR